MRCLSVWQPWASMLVHGLKRNETRAWPTSHRGPLAIHAAKKQPLSVPALLDDILNKGECGKCWRDALAALGCVIRSRNCAIDLEALPLGAIVGTVDIESCERIRFENTPADGERYFGDYTTPGRFQWRTVRPVALARSIPFRGSQGLFEVPDELIADAIESENRQCRERSNSREASNSRREQQQDARSYLRPYRSA